MAAGIQEYLNGTVPGAPGTGRTGVYFDANGRPQTIDSSANVWPLRQGIRDKFRNLLCQWATNATVTFTFDGGLLSDTSGNAIVLPATSTVTANITASGANGLDTGSEASSTWYYIWAIWNGSAVASLLSTSATAPTMPGGYTHKAIVGVVYNDASSNFAGFQQRGSCVSLTVLIPDFRHLNAGSSATFAVVTPATPAVIKKLKYQVIILVAANIFDISLNGGTSASLALGAGFTSGSETDMQVDFVLPASGSFYYRNNSGGAGTLMLYLVGFDLE